MTDIKICCADALKFIRTIPSNSIDLIFTDPPYGHNNNNGDLISRWEEALGRGKYNPDNNRPIQNDGEEANEIFRLFLPEAKRVLVPGGNICCCCGGGGPDPQFARWSLWMDEIFKFKQMIVWDKGPMGSLFFFYRPYIPWPFFFHNLYNVNFFPFSQGDVS